MSKQSSINNQDSMKKTKQIKKTNVLFNNNKRCKSLWKNV